MDVRNYIYQIVGVSVVGFVYSVILTESGMILSWWKALLERLLLKGKTHRELKQIPAHFEIKQKDYYWLYDPLVGCSLCVSGQMAFWFYIYHNHSNYIWYGHVSIICFTILCTWLINSIYIWRNQKLS